MGTSLWLVPTAVQIPRIKQLMQIKRSSAKSPSSFPRFDPHITLATVPSSTEIEKLISAVPIDQSAIPAVFKSLNVGNKYFMSVYVSVHDTGALAVLRGHLKEVLGESTVPPIPHVSLYYIDDTDADERAPVAEELRKAGRAVDRGDGGISLNTAEDPQNASDSDILDGIDGAEIWIAQCDGPVPGWQVLKKISLASPSVSHT